MTIVMAFMEWSQQLAALQGSSICQSGILIFVVSHAFTTQPRLALDLGSSYGSFLYTGLVMCCILIWMLISIRSRDQIELSFSDLRCCGLSCAQGAICLPAFCLHGFIYFQTDCNYFIAVVLCYIVYYQQSRDGL